ncbi:MAG: hypothetical protein ABI317_05475 [Gaiellales bacterium]
MARRAGLWALSGATAAAGMLIASPDAYAWLRRRAGLDQSDGSVDAPSLRDDEGGTTFDTREARLSLRARLSEAEAEAESAAETPVAAASPAEPPEQRPRAARPRPRPVREDVEPMRRAVDDARTRLLDTARKATRENGPAA